MMNNPALMIGLGEVLWDILPSGKVLGGAPANFAYMTHVLGNRGIIASRVGVDELGQEASRVMQGLGLDTSHVQQDSEHETGIASVSLDSSGQPSFTIKAPVAWDFLEWSAEWKALSATADVICFGSLAQRSETSAATIDSFLQHASSRTLCIFDVNLRQNFYTRSILEKSLRQAHIVKLNEQELTQVSSLLNWQNDTEEAIGSRLLNEYGLRLVCVTHGDRGSILISEGKVVKHPGFRVQVVDAIGAGDAFTACLAHFYLRGESLENIGEYANRFASWVATQRGATPQITPSQLQSILA